MWSGGCTLALFDLRPITDHDCKPFSKPPTQTHSKHVHSGLPIPSPDFFFFLLQSSHQASKQLLQCGQKHSDKSCILHINEGLMYPSFWLNSAEGKVLFYACSWPTNALLKCSLERSLRAYSHCLCSLYEDACLLTLHFDQARPLVVKSAAVPNVF